jgi:GT2 family glycosyltransferase
MTLIAIPTYFGGNMVLNLINSIYKNVEFPNIRIFSNDVGWLAACNLLMSECQSDIILLNDDTILISNIVKEMKELAYSDPKIGIVGGKSLTPDGLVINYGITVLKDGNTQHRFNGFRDDEITEVVKQQAVEGSLMYIKKELINEIGLFDPRYTWGYRAEVSYCFKARKAGWKVVSCPTAKYIHLTSVTSSQLGIENDTMGIFLEEWGRDLQLGLV